MPKLQAKLRILQHRRLTESGGFSTTVVERRTSGAHRLSLPEYFRR